VAISLLNFGDSSARAASVIFGSISVFFMFYALFRYRQRAVKLNFHKNSLEARGVSFEDMNGSVAMLVVVLAALGIDFFISLLNSQ
jgi:hypothetical protein